MEEEKEMNLKACPDMDLAPKGDIYKTSQESLATEDCITQFELSKVLLRNLNNYKLSPVTKLVLLALVDRLPNVFPSQQTLAKQLGVGIASVKRAIAELRSQGLILTTDSDYKSLNYKFTSKFLSPYKVPLSPKNFSDNKLIPPQDQKDTPAGIKMSDKETIKEKKEERSQSDFQQKNKSHNKTSSFNEYKNRKYRHQKGWGQHQKTGIQYQTYTPEKIDRGSPMDYTKEQAIDYLNNLPSFLKTSNMAQKLRNKWNL